MLPSQPAGRGVVRYLVFVVLDHPTAIDTLCVAVPRTVVELAERELAPTVPGRTA